MSSPANNYLPESFNFGLFSENLRELMFKNNIDSAELSKQTGIAISTINSLKRGEGNPTLSTLFGLAKFFDLSLSALAEKPLENNLVKNIHQHEIPLLDINEIDNYFKNNLKETQTIFDDLLNENVEDCFAIRISNSSLAPFFEKGTIFIINIDKKPQDGDIALVEFGENLPCFRRIFIEGNSYYFKPISDLVTNKAIFASDFVIRGIVLKAIQVF